MRNGDEKETARLSVQNLPLPLARTPGTKGQVPSSSGDRSGKGHYLEQ